MLVSSLRLSQLHTGCLPIGELDWAAQREGQLLRITLPPTPKKPERKVTLNTSAVTYARIFNNSSFEQGGRFYLPWWQIVPRNIRDALLINGEPTVEIDFPQHHVTMLYGRIGRRTGDKAYEVDAFRASWASWP